VHIKIVVFVHSLDDHGHNRGNRTGLKNHVCARALRHSETKYIRFDFTFAHALVQIVGGYAGFSLSVRVREWCEVKNVPGTESFQGSIFRALCTLRSEF
jgi:hypothetical protein